MPTKTKTSLKASKPAAVPVEKTEDPEWVAETPEDSRYSLIMFDTGGTGCQEVDVSRCEFISLKQHLAEMRGFKGISA